MYDEEKYNSDQAAEERQIAREEKRDRECFEDDMEQYRRRAPGRDVDGICKPCTEGNHAMCAGKGVFHRCICPASDASHFAPHAGPIPGQELPYVILPAHDGDYRLSDRCLDWLIFIALVGFMVALYVGFWWLGGAQ